MYNVMYMSISELHVYVYCKNTVHVQSVAYLIVVVLSFLAGGSHWMLATKAAATIRDRGSLDWRDTASGRSWTDQSDASNVVATETGRVNSRLIYSEELWVVLSFVERWESWSLVLNFLAMSWACLNQKMVSVSHSAPWRESTWTLLDRQAEELCSRGEKEQTKNKIKEKGTCLGESLYWWQPVKSLKINWRSGTFYMYIYSNN